MDSIGKALGSTSVSDVGRKNVERSMKDIKGGLASEEEIDKAAGGFESMLLNELFKSLWSTVDQSGLLGENSYEGGMYRDMYNQALADEVAKGKGIGLKTYLKAQLMKQLDASKKGAE